jgi:hypothetical protein
MSELLQARNVVKSARQIKTLYETLSSAPQTGFISFRRSQWRLAWGQLVALKDHLVQNQLVQPPKDENDLFYHIPALEDSHDTVDRIGGLLACSGGRAFFYHKFIVHFLPRHLPNLLHRDV